MTTRSTAIKPYIYIYIYIQLILNNICFFSQLNFLWGLSFLTVLQVATTGGSLHYQPQNCIVIREIPQNYHRFVCFVLFKIPPQNGKFNDPCNYILPTSPPFSPVNFSLSAFASVETACFFCGFSTADWLPFFDGGFQRNQVGTALFE